MIEPVTSVVGVCDGSLPTATFTVSDLKIVDASLQNSKGSGNFANNESLFSIFPRQNIESVDLTGSDMIFRQKFTTSIDASGTSAAINVSSVENRDSLDSDGEIFSWNTSTQCEGDDSESSSISSTWMGRGVLPAWDAKRAIENTRNAATTAGQPS